MTALHIYIFGNQCLVTCAAIAITVLHISGNDDRNPIAAAIFFSLLAVGNIAFFVRAGCVTRPTQISRMLKSYTQLAGHDHHGNDFCIDSVDVARSITARSASQQQLDFESAARGVTAEV